MKNRLTRIFCALGSLVLRSLSWGGFLIALSCASVETKKINDLISEGPFDISTRAVAPIPTEVENETQARALSREAAVSVGQTQLLNYVLQKRTHGKKTLAEAEIPYIETQNSVRALIKGARVEKTRWTESECHVVLSIAKSQLKDILQKN